MFRGAVFFCNVVMVVVVLVAVDALVVEEAVQ